MAFKCHTALETYVIITPGAHPYTSLHKYRAPLSFIKSNVWSSQESKREPVWAPKTRSREQQQSLKSCSMQSFSLHLPFSSLPTSFSWQMIWRRMAHAEPNPSYLAGDHTDGPDWASWTHRQLGVMMHRMLPINRMYCSTEASQADTPNRATEGGPAKTPTRTGEQRGSY